jgi:hypothetical protein
LNYHEDISVADVYFIYDLLKGRKPTNIIKDVLGTPLTESETQKEIVRRETKARLDQEYAESLKNLNVQKALELKKLEEKFIISIMIRLKQ